jgi:hypothetical protein
MRMRCSFLLGMAIVAMGCVRVRPVDRGLLASPCMQAGLGESGLTAGYRAKFVESKSAGGLPGNAPGGGCGCAQ